MPGAEVRALLCIDMQRSQIYGLPERLRSLGLGEVADAYDVAVSKVLAKVALLQQACRQAGIPVVHIRTASHTGDGKDGSRLFQLYGGAKGAAGASDAQAFEIVPAVAPARDEAVIGKICSGAFNGSELDFTLRKRGIRSLLVAGLVTSSCVETTVRGASDRGYFVTVIEDACADWTEASHRHSIELMGKWFGEITTAAVAISLTSRAPGL